MLRSWVQIFCTQLQRKDTQKKKEKEKKILPRQDRICNLLLSSLVGIDLHIRYPMLTGIVWSENTLISNVEIMSSNALIQLQTENTLTSCVKVMNSKIPSVQLRRKDQKKKKIEKRCPNQDKTEFATYYSLT